MAYIRTQIVGTSAERRVEREAIINFAGCFAETGLFKTFPDSSAGAQHDYDMALKKAMAVFRDEDMAVDYLDFIQSRMPDIILYQPVVAAIRAVVGELLTKKTLKARDVRALVKQALELEEEDGRGLRRILKHHVFDQKRVADRVAMVREAKERQRQKEQRTSR